MLPHSLPTAATRGHGSAVKPACLPACRLAGYSLQQLLQELQRQRLGVGELILIVGPLQALPPHGHMGEWQPCAATITQALWRSICPYVCFKAQRKERTLRRYEVMGAVGVSTS